MKEKRTARVHCECLPSYHNSSDSPATCTCSMTQARLLGGNSRGKGARIHYVSLQYLLLFTQRLELAFSMHIHVGASRASTSGFNDSL